MVFDRKPKQLIPTPVIKPVDMPSSSSSVPPTNPLPSERTKRGAYSEVINFGCSMTEREVEESASRKALEVWYLVFSSGQESWPQGFDLGQAVEAHRLDDMKLIFGNKSQHHRAKRDERSGVHQMAQDTVLLHVPIPNKCSGHRRVRDGTSQKPAPSVGHSWLSRSSKLLPVLFEDDLCRRPQGNGHSQSQANCGSK